MKSIAPRHVSFLIKDAQPALSVPYADIGASLNDQCRALMPLIKNINSWVTLKELPEHPVSPSEC